MAGRNGDRPIGEREERMSSFEEGRKAKQDLDFRADSLGQRCPTQCPQPEDELGEPMQIREVAKLIGCSVWTVRQRYLPAGLPHLRFSRHGKLVFYRHQVIRWVLEIQRQKGGTQWPFGSAAGSTGRRSG